MKLMNMTKLAFSNLKGNKSKTIITVIILSLCMIAYVLVNCVTFSVQKFTENLVEYRGFRTLEIVRESVVNQDFEKIKNITSTFEVYPNKGGNIFDSTYEFDKKPYNKNYSITLTSFYDNIVSEVIAGENIKEGQRNVGLVPNYFQPSMDDNGNGLEKEKLSFIDGRDLIGKTITIKYSYQIDIKKPPSKENSIVYSYTFKVVGVYDVLKYRMAFHSVFVPIEDMKDISKHTQPIIYDSNEYKTIGVTVDKFENVKKVENELSSAGMTVFKFQDPSPMIGISKLWTRASQIISMIILLFLIIGTYMIVSMNIKKRKSEIAVLKAFGYKESTIISNFVLEGIIISIISILTAIGVTATVLFVFWKPLLKSFVSLIFTTMEISLSNYIITIGIGSLFCILISILGILFASKKIFKIEPSEALKM